METGASNCRETSRTSDGGEGNRRLEKTKPSSLLRPSSLHLPSGVVDYSLIKATEFIAKGWNALKEEEVDRVIDYCELNDHRPIPHLRVGFLVCRHELFFFFFFGCVCVCVGIGNSRLGFDGLELLLVDYQTAKENFELALEADNSNTYARYWLSKLHLKYLFLVLVKLCESIPFSFVGAALLVESGEMGDPCSIGLGLSTANQQALFYLEKAVDQGHAGAAIAYGSLLLRGRQQLSKQNPVDKIINLKACMNFLEEPKISNEAKDLIGHLLCDVHTRLGTRGVEELKDMQYTRECCDSLLSAAAMTLHVPTGAQSKAEVRRWQRRATGTVSDAKPGVGAHFSETTGLCVKLPTESFSS
ncbi:unnamed protein product [Linum tenue]|uniref:Uncharacterized protein n=1 Tax=Linum tenue TaxID=586396 RepID=A0AAV0IVM0_9ROSI|nr:unnamed protein product [Linum tenue]